MHLQNTPAPKAQKTMWKGGQKDLKSQRSGACYDTMSPNHIRSCVHKVSPTLLHKVNKDDTNKDAQSDGRETNEEKQLWI